MQKKLYKKRDFYKKLATFAAIFLLGSVVTAVLSITVSRVFGLVLFIFAFMVFDDLDYTTKQQR